MSLDSSGKLIGVPPAAGSYDVVLSSTVGAFSDTKTVAIEVSELTVTVIDRVTRMLGLGTISLKFDAVVGVQNTAEFTAKFTFSAVAETLAVIGNVTLGFTAAAGDPVAIPEEFSIPLPANTQELVSGSGLVDSFPYDTTRSSFFSYRIIKLNSGTLDLSITGITLSSSASSVEIYFGLREDVFSGASLSLSGNGYIGSTANWSQLVNGLPPGIYYLDFEIPDNRANALDSFTVTGTWDTTLSDSNEPNFSLKTARTLPLGVPSVNKLTDGDADWFKVSTTGLPSSYKGLSLVFDQMTQLSGATPGIEVDVFTVNVDGSLGAQLNTGDWMNITMLTATTRRLEPAAPATYAVRVKYMSGEYTSYRLTAGQFEAIVDSYEDDGSMTLATTLTNGVASTGHTLNGGDEDWFKVVLTDPAVLTMSFTNIVISDYLVYPGLSISVVNSAGIYVEDFYQPFIGTSSSPLSGATSDTTVTRSTTTLAAGTYYIQVLEQNDSYDITASW